MNKVHLDFETRSKIDVTDVGPWRYSMDPSTTVLCLCYRFHSEDGKFYKATITKDDFENYFDNNVMSFETEKFTLERIHVLQQLALRPDVRFEAHNSMFEYCMWNNVLAKRFHFPALEDFDRWECTASKAAVHALPRSLGKCAIALNLPVNKDETGKRVMLQLSKPKKPSKKDPSIWCNDEEKFKTLYDYCEQDVVVEEAIDNALPPLIPFEREVWKLDQTINARGIRIDTKALDIAIDFANRFKAKLNNELLDLTGGAVSKASEIAKLTRYVRDFISEKDLPKIQSLNANDIKAYLPLCKDSKIRRILEIRQQAGKSSTSKLERMKTCICEDDKVRDILVYHGASTGRWSGAGIQVQNFPRGSKEYDIDNVIDTLLLNNYEAFELIYPNVVDAISSALRGFLISDVGEDFVTADFSAIEARVLFWLAGCNVGLQAFRNGEDIYCLMASEIYKRKITKKDKDERQLGKTCVLGCGYQMGAKHFKDYVKMITGLEITDAMAKLTVDAYRTTYPEVVGMWYGQERAAIQAVRNPGRIIQEGKIKWKVQGKFLYCKLPSGRCIAYCEPIVQPNETKWGEIKDQLTFMAVNSLNKNWERQHTYGGMITENIVQATARDLMAYGMINLEKKGYKCKMTVHDEVVSSIPEDKGSVEEFEKILATTPEWAADCPVKAEGWRGKRYRK